jgi:NADPH:quinone reductase-like Zn-dependent oxidoreductase
MSATPSRTIRFHEYGEPLDVLREEIVEVSDPPAGTVRIAVRATGLNPADWELCRGFMPGSLPRGIGLDVAGVVDAVGEGVEGTAVGDPVFGIPDYVRQPSAGAADAAILSTWVAVPDGLALEHAAVLPMVVETAAWTIDALGVGEGTTLLVNGAGSMAGYACVQVARSLGARVIATAGPTYAADLEGFGAQVTSYGEGMADRIRSLADGPIDLVLDTAPRSPGTIPTLIDIAGDPAKVVTISNHQARELGARVNLDLLDRSRLAPPAVLLADYAARAAAGRFRLPIARTFRLAEWRDAVALSSSFRARGKVVLVP